MRSNLENVAWIYIDDLGEAYWTSAKYGTVRQTDNAGRPLVGGRAPTSQSELHKVRLLAEARRTGLEVRTVTLVNRDNGHRQQAIVYSPDAPLWVGTATTIRMREPDAVEPRSEYVNLVLPTFQVCGGRGELYRGRRRRAGIAPAAPAPENSNIFDSTIEAMFAEAWQRRTEQEVVAQYPILGYRLDFAHLPSKTAIELDGYYFHADPERFRKDRQRDRELLEHGWRVVRFAGDEVLDDVDGCVEEALRLIRTGTPIDSSPP